jgi:hypothetical protein
MPTTIDSQIRTRIAEFAEELSVVVKQAAVETALEALGGSAAGPSTQPMANHPVPLARGLC